MLQLHDLRQRMHQALHLVFEVAAFALGYAYFQFLRMRNGDSIQEAERIWILVGAAAGALLGSRVLGALEQPHQLAWDWNALLLAFNNRTIVGGLLGGLVGVELTKKLLRVRTSSGDLMTYPLILGMIIGRIGCLFGGLEDNTFGVSTSLPWGMDLGDGIMRHPTNLYEILWLGITWAALLFLERKVLLSNGMRFKLFMVSYLSFRFAVEFIKAQPAVVFGLSSIQSACVLGLLYYLPVWSRPRSIFHGSTPAREQHSNDRIDPTSHQVDPR